MVFLTWFPNYLTQEKGITALKAGFMTTVPFLAAFVGVLLSGWVADLLVRKGFSLGFARKTPIICGLLISTCIMGANYTNDPMMIMCLMALAFFGNGFASITWSLVSSLAPMRLIGLTGGVFNFAVVWAASPFRWWWGTWRRVTVSHLHWFISPPSR